jgi:hypothetical protein
LDALRGDAIRRHGVAHLARIVAKLDLLKAIGAILLKGHFAHLRLAAVATELELHDGSAAGSDELSNLVQLEDESILEELGEGGLVDKLGETGDDEDARDASSDGVTAVLDAVVRDSDAVILDKEATGPRDAEELLGGLGSEEDDLGGCRGMSVEVGVIDVRAPDAADVANAREKLVNARLLREVGQPESAVLFRSEMIGTGIGLGVHAVVARRKRGRAGSVGEHVRRKGSRGSLLHHSLHGQEASGRGIGGHLSRTSSRASRDSRANRASRASRASSRGKLADGGSSRDREAKDVNSKRLVDSGFGTSRAEERAVKLREVKRRVGHVGSSRHLAVHGSDSSVVVVTRTRMLLREHGIARRLTGEALGVGWAEHVGGRVDCSREASLVGCKGRWARKGGISANEAVSLAHVGIQRAPASVRSGGSSSSLAVRRRSSSSSGALVEAGRRPDLRRLVAETREASDEARSSTARNLTARNLTATSLRAARSSGANLVDGRERANRKMGEGAEHSSGSSSRGRGALSPRGGNRLSEHSLVWSARGFGITLEAVRRRARDGISLGSVVDKVAHLGRLVVALGVHDNEGRGGRR